MQSLAARPGPSTTLLIALLILGMAATIGGALAFQHLGGYIPCQVCLWQRNPYYFGIPLAIAALVADRLGAAALARALVGLVMVLMLVGAGLGVYHSGVEWGFWEGPSSCTAPVDSVPTNAGDLLSDLNSVHGPSCAEASWRMLGLSFAGWNVVASLALAAIAAAALRRRG